MKKANNNRSSKRKIYRKSNPINSDVCKALMKVLEKYDDNKTKEEAE